MSTVVKYQVFVSATFEDIRAEREEVFWAVMRARQIPAGMELFSAADDRGWRTITRAIDDSDYYIVVVAGRYGSIDPEHGISWTEREYRYARSRGLKCLAFIQDESTIVATKMDRGPDAAALQDHLRRFKGDLAGSHLVKRWTTKEDLAAKVGDALRNVMVDDEADGARPRGWVRGGDVMATSEELARLSRENHELRVQNKALLDAQSVSLSIEVPAAQDGRVEVPLWVERLEPSGHASPFVNPALFETSREELEQYLEQKGRCIEVQVRIRNTGSLMAKNIEVTVTAAEVEEILLTFAPPHVLRVPEGNWRLDATRNVSVEGWEVTSDGAGLILQRVRAINPRGHADLVPFFILWRASSASSVNKVVVNATDSTGSTATLEAEYVISYLGERELSESQVLDG